MSTEQCLQHGQGGREREKEKDDKRFNLSIDRSKTDQRYRSTFNEMLMCVRIDSEYLTFNSIVKSVEWEELCRLSLRGRHK